MVPKIRKYKGVSKFREYFFRYVCVCKKKVINLEGNWGIKESGYGEG